MDDGFIGTDSNRGGFQRMLDDVRIKMGNCVIVKDPSRLSRNYLEAGHYMEQLFVNLDVQFISLELPALDSYKMPQQMNGVLVPYKTSSTTISAARPSSRSAAFLTPSVATANSLGCLPLTAI